VADKVGPIIGDTAANVKVPGGHFGILIIICHQAMFREPGMTAYKYHPCLNHVLQLVVKDELLSKPAVSAVCDIIRLLCSKVNQATVFANALRIAQVKPLMLCLS
jgi:hypothetical protein